MNLSICTIGFTGKTAEQFFTLLQQAGVRKVIDVRENRVGQLSGFAKFPDLDFFLESVAAIAYEHEPLFAPSPEIRKSYRATKNWPAYESAFLELMRQREIPARCALSRFEGPIALLCSEPTADQCHRRLLANLLAERFRSEGHSVEIHHLASEPPPPKPRKTRKKYPAAPRA
jgi:uncharacterized protein (DUF488 family)